MLFRSMTYVDRIVEKFGGSQSAAGKKMGLPPTTIQYWQVAGHIPSKKHGIVLRAARKHDVPLGPGDFFEPGAFKGIKQDAAATA